MQNVVIHKIKLQLVSPTKYNWENIAKKIVQGCNNPCSKAKAIYTWLCNNITYDTSFTIRTADEAIRHKKGVCQAYCELFFRIGRAVGLDVRIISGKSKNVYGKVEQGYHGWIAVNMSDNVNSSQLFPEHIIYNKGENVNNIFTATNGLNASSAILIDPTWGAGYCENGKFVRRYNDMSWFNVNPYWMAFSHFPDNPKDLLINITNFSLSTFSKMRYATPQWEGYGFKPEYTFFYFIKGQQFPTIFEGFSSYIEFDDIPISPILNNKEGYVFSFKKKKKCSLALINNDTFYIEQNGKEWMNNDGVSYIQIKNLKIGTVSISIQNPEGSNKYSTILQYRVESCTETRHKNTAKTNSSVVSKNDNKETFSESKDVKRHGSYGALNFDKRWLVKKQQILQRDHHKCKFCGSTENLTVHHTQYHVTPDGKRFLPWEYDNRFLITVCKDCYSKKMASHKTPTKVTTISKRLFE